MRPIDGAAVADTFVTHGDLRDAMDALGLVAFDGANPNNDQHGTSVRGPLRAAYAAANALGLPIRIERADE